jgi:DNA-binding beta-propeller fold protein YncE
VRLWDAQTGSLVRALAGHTKSIRAVAFTPDGKLLVSAGNDLTMKIWEVDTGKLVRSLQVTTDGIYGPSSIAFSPDGQRMASTIGATVDLWDVSDWSRLRSFTTGESHTSGDITYCCGSTAEAVRFDARGQLVISAHEDGTIKVWNPNPAQPLPLTGDELVRVLQTSARNESFAFSPDEKLLVANSGGEPPKVWDWSSGKPLQSLGEEATYAHSVIFSPDSRLIATSDIGGDIILWSASSGKVVRQFDGGYSSDDALAFSPDGTRLASGGENQNIIMWDVKTGARLWHILPVREIQRPTAIEIAEQKHAAALAAAKEEVAARETERLSQKVFLRFSHFGEVTNPAEMRMAETARPKKSLIRRDESEATGIWIRLHNDSSLPIQLWTESIFIPSGKKCGYRTSTGKFFIGLCEGSEFGIQVSVFDSKGNPVRYGFDFGGIAMLPPKTSVLFSVPRELLREGRSIVVRYQFLSEGVKGKLVEYAKERELRFAERNLRRAER